MALTSRNMLIVVLIALIFFTCQTHAFGAGNIASISAVEGKNWRHGDIEDMLKTIACIRHHKWSSMMIKRVYFGNWLRDYSQAMDTGALKKAQPETIRILVWLLSFLGFGYATAEFEVTSERLGVYRPEEHIDNPKDYNDNEDARTYDPRLRAPVREIELQVDMETGMKNYIANGKGDWATSFAFVKYSFERSIHHGRLYTNGHGLFKGKDEDLAEALRCLGQGLHTLEDFGAHTNYVELALMELGFRNVFPHVGSSTAINLHGKHTFPLVTGTFGMVDFYHSVLGEATDHFTQSEVNEMDNALGTAQAAAQSSNPLTTLVKLLSKVPGTRDLCDEASRLQAASQQQARETAQGGGWGGQRGVEDYSGSSRAPGDWNPPHGSNDFPPQSQGFHQDWNQPQQGFQQQTQHQQGFDSNQFPGATHQWGQEPQQQPPPPQPQWSQQQTSQSQWGQSQPSQPLWNQQQQPPPHQATPSQPLQQPISAPQGLPGAPNFDPAKTIAQIYPILAFRDKVVRTISSIIEKIPGLEALVDRIVETLTIFVLSLLAPFIRPVLEGLSKTLQTGSEGVLSSSAKHQYEVWTDPHSTDPTHSMLSKDHFSNLLNEPAGLVAAEIVKFIAPRVLYAWEHTDVPVPQVMQDVAAIFHHPALRSDRVEVHRSMFDAVQKWVNNRPDRGRELEAVLSSEAVRAGKNHKAGVNEHAAMQPNVPAQHSMGSGGGGGFAGYGTSGGGGDSSNSPFGMVGGMLGGHGGQQHHNQQSGGLGDMLNLANKLPIPGVQNLTGQLNKYSKYLPGSSGGGSSHSGPFNLGFGQRGLDDHDGDVASGGIGDDGEGYAYGGIGVGSQVGGAQELHEAVKEGDSNRRSPSPMPMAAPAGYEMYSSGHGSGGGGYGPQEGGADAYQGQGQGQYGGGDDHYGRQQGYGGGGGGGQGDNYYR